MTRNTSPDSVMDRQTDLQTQLEDILHSVWMAEADWRLSDRIDMATKTRRR